MELTAQEEIIVTENLEVFRKNGFEFEIDQEAPPTKRIKLLTLPYSKGTQFGISGKTKTKKKKEEKKKKKEEKRKKEEKEKKKIQFFFFLPKWL